MKLTIVLAFLLLCFQIDLHAQWENPKIISGQSAYYYTSGLVYSPSLLNSGAKIFAVWSEWDNFGHATIFINSSNDSGATWGSSKAITDSAKASISTAIAISSSRLHLIWYDYQRTLYSYSNDSGMNWSTPTVIDSSIGYNQSSYSSIAASGNNVLIAYSKTIGNASKAFVVRSTDQGNTWSSPFEISGSNDSTGHTSLAISGNNTYCGWYDNKLARIQLRHSTDFGATWNNAVTAAATASGRVADNFMISADGNNVDIPFTRNNYGMNYWFSQIWIAQSTNNGATFNDKAVTQMQQFFQGGFGLVIVKRDGSRLHLSTSGHQYFRSYDSGNSWSTFNSPALGYYTDLLITGEIVHAFGVSVNTGVSYTRHLHANRPLYTGILSSVSSQPEMMQVYPNPANGTVNFNLQNLTAQGIYEISLINSMGQHIWNGSTTNGSTVSFNTCTLASGIYFYKLMNAGEIMQTGRLVIQ